MQSASQRGDQWPKMPVKMKGALSYETNHCLVKTQVSEERTWTGWRDTHRRHEHDHGDQWIVDRIGSHLLCLSPAAGFDQRCCIGRGFGHARHRHIEHPGIGLGLLRSPSIQRPNRQLECDELAVKRLDQWELLLLQQYSRRLAQRRVQAPPPAKAAVREARRPAMPSLRRKRRRFHYGSEGWSGFPTLNVTATATAAMAGGFNTPWNIAIIMDTTNSMSERDGGRSAITRESTAPCSVCRSCCSDLVSLPTGTDLHGDERRGSCGCGQPVRLSRGDECGRYGRHYLPDKHSFVSGGCLHDAEYQPSLHPWDRAGLKPDAALDRHVSDRYVRSNRTYKTTDTSSTLNTASPVAIAAGEGGTSCTNGLYAPGGEGTYYAQAIFAAQAALPRSRATTPGSQNAIILLSDGDARRAHPTPYDRRSLQYQGAALSRRQGTLNGTGTSSSNPSGYRSPTYPSALGECGQAMLAAQYAANQGTAVYTIGYGAPTSGGCATDQDI